VLRPYSTDPTLQSLLHINPSDAVRCLAFNLAEPPFDDIHIRKAVNLALDKDGMRTFRGGPSVGEIAGHIMVDSLENNLLKDYDPYATPNSSDDVNAAKEEIKQYGFERLDLAVDGLTHEFDVR
jgi:ABC-type transport system substrate-binding protein